MTFNRFFTLTVLLSVSGCSAVVEPIKIPALSPNPQLQEELSIDLAPLTFDAAKELNLHPYPRFLRSPSNSSSANKVAQSSIEQNQFPTNAPEYTYKIGIGDELTFIRLENESITVDQQNIVQSPSGAAEEQSISMLTAPVLATPEVIGPKRTLFSTKGRVASDGSLFLIGLGRLDAEGRSLASLRDEVRNALIRDGQIPDFQLDITSFNSQKAYITTDRPSSEASDQIRFVLPITDREVPLREILATAGITFNKKLLTIVKIQREGKTYSFSLDKLYSERAPIIFLQNQDHVFIESLEYAKEKVFLVGGVQPQLVEIEADMRNTLAEILFSKGGPLGDPTAQRSAVYLLRGQSPIKAYHLDTQNPARLLVADAVELRPDDIVYVAEQPISTFNRVLATILPLRIFSRDVQNDNIP